MFLEIKKFFVKIKNDFEIFFNKVIRLTIYLGVLILPLFFIPLGNNLYEYSKVVLFYVFVAIAMLVWLLKIFLSKKIKLESKVLDIPLILLSLVYFIASIFSVDTYNSLLGKNISLTNSFTTILFLLIFYFIVSRHINKIKQFRIILVLIIISVLLIIISNILPLLPVNYGFLFGMTINTFNLLLFFAFSACGILFLISKKNKFRYVYLFLGLIILLSLFFIDNQYILLALALAIFLYIFLLSFKSRDFSNKLVVALTFLLFITVIILILPINNLTGIKAPLQFNIPNQFAWEIGKATLADNLLFAVGPQNFVYSFYSNKPVEFNLTPYWQLGFTKSANYWLEILTTCGLITILLFASIFVKYFQSLIFYIRKNKIEGIYSYKKYLIVAALSVIISIYMIWGFFDNFHFISLYFLFLFLALAVSFLCTTKAVNVFSNKNIINLGFYIIILLFVSAVYFISPIIITDINIERISLREHQSPADFEQSAAYLHKAIEKNNERTDYKLKLANLYINKLTFLKNNPDIEFDKTELESDIFNNLDEILNLNNQIIDNYLGLRIAYNALASQGYQVTEQQEKVNNLLLEIDLVNPELYIDRALINFAKYLAITASGIQPDDEKDIVSLINQIQSDIEKSIELKNDFVLGYYNYGLYWQEFGEQDKAIENIQKAFSLDPTQQLIALSLKKLYLNQDKVKEAIAVLEEYLKINSGDSEVRIELAIIYKNNNDIDKAIEELTSVLNQDPDNELAKEILAELE